MKAVNLLPSDARRGSGNGALSGLGIGTTAVFGALGLALALTVAYVILANGVTTRKDTLTKVTAQSAAAQKQVVALKPYADLESLRESLLDRVRSLAGGRYDWSTQISRIARALPANTKLTSFTGTPAGGSSASAPAPATPAATPGATPAAAAPAAGPTVSLEGCTPSHVAVARVIDRLRAVDGVSGVSLQSSSTGAAGSAGSGGGCSAKEQFKLTIALSAPAAPAAPATTAGATPGAAAAPSTTTPTPSSTPASPQASTGTSSGGNS